MECIGLLVQILLKLFGNFSSTLVDSLVLFNAILILDLLAGRLSHFFALIDVMYMLHHLINKTTMVSLKKQWEVLTNIARAFLANAQLPKRFWYLTIREATHRVNILPVRSNPDYPTDPISMTTLHFEFYGTKPDY